MPESLREDNHEFAFASLREQQLMRGKDKPIARFYGLPKIHKTDVPLRPVWRLSGKKLPGTTVFTSKVKIGLGSLGQKFNSLINFRLCSYVHTSIAHIICHNSDPKRPNHSSYLRLWAQTLNLSNTSRSSQAVLFNFWNFKLNSSNCILPILATCKYLLRVNAH